MIYIDIVGGDMFTDGEIWIGDTRIVAQHDEVADCEELAGYIESAFSAAGKAASCRRFESDDDSKEAGPFRIEHGHDLTGNGTEFDGYNTAVSYLNENFDAEGDETAICYEVLNRFGNTVYMHRQDWQDDE
jgi:hypothetical protein